MKKKYDHPMVVEETWEAYTAEEHARWAFLYRRQKELLPGRAADEVIEGMKILNVTEKEIPRYADLNAILEKRTGFEVIPVQAMIPEDFFFELLADRKFPGTTFIRSEDQIDYLKEPDVFHEIFGHIPLLTHPIFADYMQEFGKLGLEGIKKGFRKYALALYWFTVEFGLIQTPKGLRIYGAGITSSIAESKYAVESDKPVRVWFDPIRAMKTKYRIDEFQKTYFVIHDYEELFSMIKGLEWDTIANDLQSRSDIDAGAVVSQTELI